MREIKFRAWDGKKLYAVDRIDLTSHSFPIAVGSYSTGREKPLPINGGSMLMQYTGVKDKNGDKEIYECDIIDTDGNVIGNQYETPTLLEEKTNLLIQGFGTKDWFTTYTQAVERGCHDA